MESQQFSQIQRCGLALFSAATTSLAVLFSSALFGNFLGTLAFSNSGSDDLSHTLPFYFFGGLIGGYLLLPKHVLPVLPDQNFQVGRALIGGGLSTLLACFIALILGQFFTEIFQRTTVSQANSTDFTNTLTSFAVIIYKAPAHALILCFLTAPLTALLARLLHRRHLQTPPRSDFRYDVRPKIHPATLPENQNDNRKITPALFTWKHKLGLALCTAFFPILPLLLSNDSGTAFVSLLYLPGGLIAGYFILFRYLSKTNHHPSEAYMGGCLTIISAFFINMVVFLIFTITLGYPLQELGKNLNSEADTTLLFHLISYALTSLVFFGLLATLLDYLYFKLRTQSPIHTHGSRFKH